MDTSQGNLSVYSSLNSEQNSWASSTGQATVTWNSYGTNDSMIKNGHGHTSSSGYQYDAHREAPVPRDAQGGTNGTSQASTSSGPVAANATQDYYGYASYPNSNDPASYPNSNDPYGYSTVGYQSYYYGYQQLANDSSSHHVGVNQNSGVPYQPLSSFQNSASSIGPSYSVTYYNAGDHQTMAAYQSGSYNNQTNVWNDGNSGSYPFQHYSSYTSSDTTSAQINATTPANTQYYQHPYSQWSGYYGHTAPTVSCAPGTGIASVTTANAVGGPAQGVSGEPGGNPYSNNPPPPPGTTSWRRDSVSSSLPSLQGKNDVTGYSANAEIGPPESQNQHSNQVPSCFQTPLNTNSLTHNSEDQQKTIYSQGPRLQLSSTNQVPEKFQPPLQILPMVDSRVAKIQIPTNPRITSTLPLVMPKANKESTVNDAVAKPAYVGISVPKPSDKLSSHCDAEAMIKGTLPASLRAYVERSFARCKDDAQRAANQNIMKEMITKASKDGTLFTRNWDIEPLFPLQPNTTSDTENRSTITGSGSASSLPKRSPTRRAKSRWEPIPEEKLFENPLPAGHELAKDVSFNRLTETERVAHDRKYETADIGWNGVKFSLSQQISFNKTSHRPVKKQRFGDASNVMENGDASNDADEKSLTKYYSSAIALATPEEKKRREHRSKRFEKGQEHQAEIKPNSSKSTGSGNLYTRRANALLLSKTFDNSCSRAVEDIDWDALTVKGTCQDVEKRYLRLTSAPGPATVRPEDVLVKALQIVQTSEKNYLYKCDQLKSIRQDLTVQRIQNELTVKVYETHARYALEAGDLPEYNQCQSQLKSLYAEGITGSNMEFSAYNLLCVIQHSNNKRDVLSLMIRLSSQAKDDQAVKHALAVRRAVSSGNYVLFFRLYKEASNLSACLMDLYVEKMRFEAVRCISKSYRPAIPVSYISHVLGFSRKAAEVEREGKGIDGLKESEEWLRAHGACLTVDSNGELQMDTKGTSSSLYMPEPEDAVAHGDANLAVDDFLTRASS